MTDCIRAEAVRELAARWEDEAWRSTPEEASALRYCQHELEEAISKHATATPAVRDAGEWVVDGEGMVVEEQTGIPLSDVDIAGAIRCALTAPGRWRMTLTPEAGDGDE